MCEAVLQVDSTVFRFPAFHKAILTTVYFLESVAPSIYCFLGANKTFVRCLRDSPIVPNP